MSERNLRSIHDSLFDDNIRVDVPLGVVSQGSLMYQRRLRGVTVFVPFDVTHAEIDAVAAVLNEVADAAETNPATSEASDVPAS
jgi:hypothetical protein